MQPNFNQLHAALRYVVQKAHEAARALRAAFRSSPPLAHLLPDTAEECLFRIGQIQSNPHYTFEQKRFAVLLLEAREKALRERARNIRAQQEYEQRQVQRQTTETGHVPVRPQPPFEGF